MSGLQRSRPLSGSLFLAPDTLLSALDGNFPTSECTACLGWGHQRDACPNFLGCSMCAGFGHRPSGCINAEFYGKLVTRSRLLEDKMTEMGKDLEDLKIRFKAVEGQLRDRDKQLEAKAAEEATHAEEAKRTAAEREKEIASLKEQIAEDKLQRKRSTEQSAEEMRKLNVQLTELAEGTRKLYQAWGKCLVNYNYANYALAEEETKSI